MLKKIIIAMAVFVSFFGTVNADPANGYEYDISRTICLKRDEGVFVRYDNALDNYSCKKISAYEIWITELFALGYQAYYSAQDNADNGFSCTDIDNGIWLELALPTGEVEHACLRQV